MDFDNKTIIIGISPRDLELPHYGKHLIVDVVLVDKSSEILYPLLYQLKDEESHSDLDIERLHSNGYFPLKNNAFVMIGEVLELDKKKKQIYLKNNNTVTYKHLIIASGLSQTQTRSVHDQQLSDGFHTLSEALRINKNTEKLRNAISFDHWEFSKHKQPIHTPLKMNTESTIQNLVKSLTGNIPSKSLDMLLAGTSRRLYEVQL